MPNASYSRPALFVAGALWTRHALAVGIVLLATWGCGGSPRRESPTPPAEAAPKEQPESPPSLPPPTADDKGDDGRVRLVVEALSVERAGKGHVVVVRTRTNTGGWIVELVPTRYDAPPEIWSFTLLGTPPVGPADDAITPHTLRLPFRFPPTTLAVEILGRTAPLRTALPR